MSEKGENMLWIEQLQTIDTMASAFLLLLDSVATDYIDDKIVDSWLSTIYRKLSFTNTIPEKECRTVIDSNGKFVTISNKTIWMGVDGEDSYQHECSFLYPSEKEGLIKCNHIRFWDETKEQLYYGYMKMLPFLMTRNQLILVVCEYRNGEITQKHPLYIRLKSSIENIELITEYPKIDISDKKEVDKISNIPVSGELNFKYADKLIWPRHLSPTSISTLIEYPFDFLMEKILHIEADSKVKMDDVKATMGNVAHAVIEKLFAPRGESKYSTFDDVESRFKRELKKIYIEIVEAKGAILLLYENRLREKLLYEQLKKCIKVLLEILKDNKLRVKACEKQVECNMNFGLNKELDDIIGVVDMILVDEKEKYIIFDFKWTSSKKYYPELLSKNRSIQLELYRYMLSTKVKNNIEKVAYFIMPEALLYSRESFDGKYCILQKSEDDSNIVEQLCNSVRYRMKQINSGVVETNDEFDSLQYVKESNEKNLFPLIKDDETNMKKSNIFSNYNLILK